MSGALIQRHPRRASWAVGFALWTLLGVSYTLAYMGRARLTDEPMTWAVAFGWFLPFCYLWMLLAAIPIALARWVGFDARAWRRALAVHLPTALVLALVHHIVFFTLYWQLGSPLLIRGTPLAEAVQGTLSWRVHDGLVIYALVLLSLYVLHYARRRAEPLGDRAGMPPGRASVASTADQVFADGDAGFGFLDPARREKLAAAFPAVDAVMEDERANQQVSGLAIGIVIDGELAHAAGFGVTDLVTKARPDADTVYRVGSVTKTFTALAILALRDRGALRLDDPLARWIPEASQLVYPSRDSPPITLRQMLSHGSGLPWGGGFDPSGAPTEDQIARSLIGLPLENAPGVVLYSNLGFSLLGIVAGRAAGRSFQDVVAADILAPLGMTSTFWAADSIPASRLATNDGFAPPGGPPDPSGKAKPQIRMGAAEASGGLYSSVRDLARYVAFQLAAYPPRNAPDDRPVRRATLREAHTVGIADGGSIRAAIAPRPGEPVVEYAARSWGLGWGAVTTCDFDDLVGKGGSIDSYRADITLLTARGVGIVVLSNFGNADPIAFANRALRELARSGALARRAPRLPAAFQPAMTAFLAIYNRWNEPAYRSMLDPDRGPAPGENDELAGYKRLHGDCASFTPIDVTSPREARFALHCERGSFEIALALSSTSGRVTGFTGTSRGVAAPGEIRVAADAISALTARWSADAYDRLPGVSRPDRDTARRCSKLCGPHTARAGSPSSCTKA